MDMKIIGAGFGRTGTTSLQLAIERLGFGKCYHMEELLRNPEGVIFWKNAFQEKKVDWAKLFEKYQSIVDFPGALYYKELAGYYPQSKIILTIRDPEEWYQSVYSTIFSFDPGYAIKLRMVLMMPFSATARNLFQVIMLNDKSTWKKYFEGNFKDKNYAIQRFNDHIEDVKKSIPKERLLIFESKDGWEPLCDFLNVEIPSEPYPNSNKKEDFHERAKNIVKGVLK